MASEGIQILFGSFKMILVGDGGVGNSTLLRCFQDIDSKRTYTHKAEAAVRELLFFTNHGQIVFQVWDLCRFSCWTYRDSFYQEAHCAIIMFDKTSRLSYKNVLRWHHNIVQAVGNIPIILCGNKVDLVNRKVSAKVSTFHAKENLDYYDISAKANYNIEKPFISLARILSGHEMLSTPCPSPSSAELDEKAIEQFRNEMDEIAKAYCASDSEEYF